MKQIVQNLKTGDVDVMDVPVPATRPGFVLVRTASSLISAGTERLTVEAGQKTLISRALEQPHLVKQVIEAENIDEKRWPARTLAMFIDGWKNRGLSPTDIPEGDSQAFAFGNVATKSVAIILVAIEKANVRAVVTRRLDLCFGRISRDRYD